MALTIEEDRSRLGADYIIGYMSERREREQALPLRLPVNWPNVRSERGC